MHSAIQAVVLSDDLLFTSQITGHARALDVSIISVKDVAGILRLAETTSLRCAIIDLSHPGLDIAGLVAALKARPEPVQVIAYGSHVDVDTLKRARAAGCDRVMPRSQFVEELPRTLGEWVRAGE